MDFRLIVPRSISLSHCPKCNTIASLDRVRIDNIYDKALLRIFKIRSYHCKKCKWKGKFILYKIRNKPWQVIFNYAIIAIIVIVLVLIINIYLSK